MRSIRLSRDRTIQRQVLNLGELNTTQIERWPRSIEVIEQEGETRQYRLFTDREGAAPAEAHDVCEVVLSCLSVRRPREFDACWLGSRLWQELKLDQFFATALGDRHGSVEWAKVIELLAVNRLCKPESELGVHRLNQANAPGSSFSEEVLATLKTEIAMRTFFGRYLAPHHRRHRRQDPQDAFFFHIMPSPSSNGARADHRAHPCRT